MGASLTAVFSLVYIPQLASFSLVLLVPALAILVIKSAYTLMAGRFFAENERNRQEAEMDNRSFLYSAFNAAFALIAAAIDDLMDAQRKIFLMKPMMTQLGVILSAAKESSSEQTILRRLRGDIRVEHVSFAYEDSTVGCRA